MIKCADIPYNFGSINSLLYNFTCSKQITLAIYFVKLLKDCLRAGNKQKCV